MSTRAAAAAGGGTVNSMLETLSDKIDALSESVGGTRRLALAAAAGAGAVAAAYYVVPVAWQACFHSEVDPYGQGEVIQPNVVSDLKDESLFLVIYLKCEADLKACAAAAARLQSHVVLINQTKPGAAINRDYEVLAGVGFGQNLYSQVVGRTTRPFSYVPRNGRGGSLNATGGDIFIHAKSNSHSKLFELADRVIKSFPRGSIDYFEDLYGFIYKDGRDFTGCPYGRANPTNDADRFLASVNDHTQGSFCLTQKWVHDMSKVHSMSKRKLENIFGIYKDGSDMRYRSSNSHVARMRSATDPNNNSIVIYRQSMPFGSLSSREKGLFFVGFADEPERFEVLLDRMVGACPDGQCDEMFQVSRCLTGQYWYFPSIAELRLVARKDCCSILSCISSPFSGKNRKCPASAKTTGNITRKLSVTTDTPLQEQAVYTPQSVTRITPTVQISSGSGSGTDNSDIENINNSNQSSSLMRRFTFGRRAAPRNNNTTVAVDILPASKTSSSANRLSIGTAAAAVEVYGGDGLSSPARVIVQPVNDSNNNNSRDINSYGDSCATSVVVNGRQNYNNNNNNAAQIVTSSSNPQRLPELYPSKLYFSNNGQVSASYRRNGL